MSEEYKLCEGKYTVIYNNGLITEVKRYNKGWMIHSDVVGNNLLNILFERILELEQELKSNG